MKVKDLKHGDVVKTINGTTATIVSCKKSKLFEAAPGSGGAYEIEYRDGKETGRVIASGDDVLET